MRASTTKFRIQALVVVSDAEAPNVALGKLRYSFDEVIEDIEDLPFLMNGMAKSLIKQVK